MKHLWGLATLLLGYCFFSACVASPLPPHTTQNSECMASRPEGLCTVDPNTHKFHPPNPLLPESTRGVFWIDSGDYTSGKTNPWVDLNFLQPFPNGSKEEGKFWVMDAHPQYQSWVDVPASLRYVKHLKSIGSRSEVDPVTLTVTWSACGFTCGTKYEVFLPLPLSSPSQKIGPNEYIRKAVVGGVTIATWKGYRIIDQSGERTEFFAKMLASVNNTAMMLPETQTKSAES